MSSSGSSLWKLSAMMLGLVAAAMLLLWALTTWALHRTFDVVGRAVIMDDIGEYGVLYERGGVEGVRALFTAGKHEHDQLMRIVAPDGTLVMEVLTPELPNVTWPDLSKSPLAATEDISWHRHPLSDGSTLTVGRTKLHDGAELWFGRTDAQDLEAIQRVHQLILLVMLITALLSSGPLIWFASRVLRPVRDLIITAHKLADHETLKHRLTTTAAIPELHEFAHAFNASLDRVDSLTEELEAANDQLAHELRTPLARIRGNLEWVLAHADNEQAREGAARAVEEIERATSLIQTVLGIRAGDARSMRLQLEMTSLLDLVSETCELYSAAAEEKKIDFGLFLTGEDVQMLVDRQRMRQVICNLLDNALAYTPDGGRVQVELEMTEAFAVLHVRDSGPGLNDKDAQRIWRRFMRGSAASASTPGIGLGLSLVKAVANAHRGEVGAENCEGGGAHFWVRLPVS